MSDTSTPQARKLSGIRSVIAGRMMESLASSAQLTYFADADLTSLLAQRKAWKANGHVIGIEDCIINALGQVLFKFPEFNALLEDSRFAVCQSIDISVAISTPSGLMTPVLRSIESSSLAEIAARRRDLVERAQSGKLKVSEMRGGTFTISNLGLTRVTHFTPILNRPQVALLGIGRIEAQARRGGYGELDWRDIMGLSLTADHQVLDGEPCGKFLETLCEELEAFTGSP